MKILSFKMSFTWLKLAFQQYQLPFKQFHHLFYPFYTHPSISIFNISKFVFTHIQSHTHFVSNEMPCTYIIYEQVPSFPSHFTLLYLLLVKWNGDFCICVRAFEYIWNSCRLFRTRYQFIAASRSHGRILWANIKLWGGEIG